MVASTVDSTRAAPSSRINSFSPAGPPIQLFFQIILYSITLSLSNAYIFFLVYDIYWGRKRCLFLRQVVAGISPVFGRIVFSEGAEAEADRQSHILQADLVNSNIPRGCLVCNDITLFSSGPPTSSLKYPVSKRVLDIQLATGFHCHLRRKCRYDPGILLPNPPTAADLSRRELSALCTSPAISTHTLFPNRRVYGHLLAAIFRDNDAHLYYDLALSIGLRR